MGSWIANLGRVVAAGALALGSTSCAAEYVMIQTGSFPKPFIYWDSLEWTREGSDAFSTIHDFEQAKAAAYGGIGTLEGLHRLVPDDENGLFMLSRGWSGLAAGFIDDEREEAKAAGDEELETYQEVRARMAFRRSRFFGERLLGKYAPGFDKAQKNADTLTAWLKANVTDPDRAEEMIWLGVSIVGRIAFDMDNPEAVAELWVGVELLEHAARLDDTVEYGLVHGILGTYHARSAVAELDEAKEHFDQAMKLGGDKVLTTKVNLAYRYYCSKGDKEAYFKTLKEVVEAGDPLPERRLMNVLAQRKARRYLDHDVFQEECAFRE